MRSTISSKGQITVPKAIQDQLQLRPADFADYLLAQVNKANACDTTWTFDRKASKSPWHTLVATKSL